MRLSQMQIEEYQREGIVFLPALFEPSEIAALKAEQARIFTLDLAAHLRAASGEFLGTTAMDRVSPLYARLLRDERLLAIAEQLIGPQLYCHQYKIILKQPFGKLDLPWHQDFGPWHHHDGMPAPRAVSLSLYLDEVTEFNGPIVFIPGSHRAGLLPYEVTPVPGTTPIPSLSNATVTRLAQAGGLLAPKGAPGAVTLFDCCLAHASGPNQSPYQRHLIYLSYNPVSNAIRKPTRPSHFAAQDFTPLSAAPRAALLA